MSPPAFSTCCVARRMEYNCKRAGCKSKSGSVGFSCSCSCSCFLNSLTPISCIIPTLHRGAALLDTIAMLLHQHSPPLEIIIVDQTPSHPTAIQLALDALQRSRQILLLRQLEPNASKARNAGALAASGQFLLFLDDDVLLPTSLIASYSDAFRRTSALAISGQILEADAQTTNRLPARAAHPSLGWLYFPKNYSQPCWTSFMMAGNFAIRRTTFLQLGGMDESFPRGAYREETDFALRFLRAGYSFRFEPQCSLYHLGPSAVPAGGARTWSRGRDFRYFHHCIGDWYFNLKHATPTTAAPLLFRSLRYFVLNRTRLTRPWRMVAALLFWAAALPVAALKVARGPRLIPGPASR